MKNIILFIDIHKFFLNFGLYSNIKRFFNTDPPKGDHLSCLDGIRFLSISWVMMGHIFSTELDTFPISNILPFYTIFKRYEFHDREIINVVLTCSFAQRVYSKSIPP